jgi:hypothetical protein
MQTWVEALEHSLMLIMDFHYYDHIFLPNLGSLFGFHFQYSGGQCPLRQIKTTLEV